MPYFGLEKTSVALVPGVGPLDGPIYNFGKQLGAPAQRRIGGALRWSPFVY